MLVDVTPPDGKVIDDLEDLVLRIEFKAGVNAYLASTAHTQIKTRTLAELIAFNAAEPRETELFGQETILEAQASPGLDDPAYLLATADAKRLAGPEGIDKLFSNAKVEVLVAVRGSPPRWWTGSTEAGGWAHPPPCRPWRAICTSPCRWALSRACRWGFPSSEPPGQRPGCPPSVTPLNR